MSLYDSVDLCKKASLSHIDVIVNDRPAVPIYNPGRDSYWYSYFEDAQAPKEDAVY